MLSMKTIQAWGIFKRDGKFVAAYPSRADARSVAIDVIDDAGRKAVVKKVKITKA